MRMIMITLFAVIISACSTIGSLQPGHGGSSFQVSGKCYDEIWKAAVTTTSRSLTIVQSDKAAGIIKAEKSAGIATSGEVVGVFITPANVKSSKYTVEVQSLKRASLQITGQNWEKTIISGMQAELQ